MSADQIKRPYRVEWMDDETQKWVHYKSHPKKHQAIRDAKWIAFNTVHISRARVRGTCEVLWPTEHDFDNGWDDA